MSHATSLPRAKVLTFRTHSHSALNDTYFRPSLFRHEPHVELEEHVFEFDSDGTFLSDGWRKAVYARIVGLLRAIDSCEEGSILVVLDVDILILRPFLTDLLARMHEGQLDFVVQSEYRSERVNAGCFAFRANSRVRHFFYNILEATLTDATGLNLDQQYMDILLPRSGLRFARLPASLYANATNQGLCAQSLLYHANDTAPRDGKSSIELKMDTFATLFPHSNE